MLQRQIVIVEDDSFLRNLVTSFLANAGFLTASAGNAVDAVKVIKDVDPDALVLDIDLGDGLSGIDVARRFKASEAGIGLVFLTSIADDRFVNADMSKEFPKAAYLNKNMLKDPQTLVEALESVLSDDDSSRIRHDKSASRPFADLTETQVRVLQLLADGKTNQQISDIRGTSLEATEAVIGRLMKALGLDNGETQNSRVLAAKKYLPVSYTHLTLPTTSRV